MGPKRKSSSTGGHSKFRRVDSDGLNEPTEETSDKWEPPRYPQDMYEELNEDMDCEIRDQKDDPYYDRKQELLSDCMLLAGDESTGRKSLNIAIIGPPGCGKSAFLNTVFASFNNDCWFEFAKSGEFGNLEGVMGMQISTRLKSFPKTQYYGKKDGVLLPTFVDMTGFENDASWINEELLYLVFCGKVKENEILNDILNYGKTNGITAMREKYRSRLSHRRINRIIVVSSANPDSAIPSLLFRTVVKLAKELDITYYGVLTHADKFRAKHNRTIVEREETFVKLLGLPKNRYARVANYCPEVEPSLCYEDTVIPSLDVPVLKLMRQVLTPEPNDRIMYAEDYLQSFFTLARWAFVMLIIAFICRAFIRIRFDK